MFKVLFDRKSHKTFRWIYSISIYSIYWFVKPFVDELIKLYNSNWCTKIDETSTINLNLTAFYLKITSKAVFKI